MARYRADGAVCITHAPGVENHDFDLIVLADDCSRTAETIVSLANVVYDRSRVIVVCQRPDMRRQITQLLCGMRLALPAHSAFFPKEELALNDMRTAGLQSVKSEYFGLLRAGDMLHPKTLHRISEQLTATPSDGVVVRRAQLNTLGWAAPVDLPPDRFVAYRTEAVVKLGGYQSVGLHLHDPEWRLYKELQPVDLPELLYYRYGCAADVDAAEKAELFWGHTC